MASQYADHGFYVGQVFHRRLIQPVYSFVYRVFNVLVDIDHVDQLASQLALFSHNRFNLFSFYDHDHLPKAYLDGNPSGSLRDWIEQGLAAHGIELNGGRVRLFCYPRILGFVFNPLSVWYCEDDQGNLVAVLCEVRNTFKERHCYLLRNPKGELLDLGHVHRHPKLFHVSPFLPVAGSYEFRFGLTDESLDVGIVWIHQQQRSMIATQRMRKVATTDGVLLKTFFSLPLMTLKVVFAIHWQALKIWLRGARFHRKPEPPHKEISSDV